MHNLAKSNSIISNDGVKVNYWINSSRDNSKVSILHPGASCNHTSLYKLEQLINEDNATLILDPRGTGLSDKPNKKEAYSLENYTNDITKIIEQEGIEKPKFIGHSMGFMPLVNYSSKTENAENIVGMNTSHQFRETVPNKLMLKVFDKVLRYTEYISSAMQSIKRKENHYTNLAVENDSDMYFAITNVPFEEITAHVKSGPEILDWNIQEQLENTKTPIYLLFGNKDPMIDSKLVMSELNGTEHQTLEGAHSLPTLHPNEVYKAIQQMYNN